MRPTATPVSATARSLLRRREPETYNGHDGCQEPDHDQDMGQRHGVSQRAKKKEVRKSSMTALAARAGIAAAKKFMPCWSCNSQKI